MPSENGADLNRRSYLGLIGAASAFPFLTGHAGADKTGDDQYDRIVDITDAGADNTGEELIDAVFADQARDDTLIKFPPGEYRANQLNLYELSNFAMVGDDATLVPGDDYNETVWLGGSNLTNVRVENFTLDHTGEGVGPQLDFNAYDSLTVRNIHKQGVHDGTGVAVHCQMIDDDGEGLIENLQMADGGTSVGMYVQGDGPVTVRDCHIEGFTNNGLYASHNTAPVTVEGGLFKDNNIAQIRVGSADSSITGVTVEVTRPHHGPDTDVVNMRGIRVADGPGPVTVDDCDISLRGAQGTGGIVTAYSGGSLDVVDTRIFVDPEYTLPSSDGDLTSYGIFVDNESGVDAGSRTFTNVSITGGGQFMAGVLIRRDDNVFDRLCLNQDGDERNGIILENSSNNSLTDATINVPDEELVLRDASIKKANVATSGSCPAPTTVDRSGAEDSSQEAPSESDDTETTEETTTETDNSTPTEETTSETEKSATPEEPATETSTPSEQDAASESTNATETPTQSSETDAQQSAVTDNSTSSSSSTTEQKTIADDDSQCDK